MSSQTSAGSLLKAMEARRVTTASGLFMSRSRDFVTGEAKISVSVDAFDCMTATFFSTGPVSSESTISLEKQQIVLSML